MRQNISFSSALLFVACASSAPRFHYYTHSTFVSFISGAAAPIADFLRRMLPSCFCFAPPSVSALDYRSPTRANGLKIVQRHPSKEGQREEERVDESAGQNSFRDTLPAVYPSSGVSTTVIGRFSGYVDACVAHTFCALDRQSVLVEVREGRGHFFNLESIEFRESAMLAHHASVRT